MSMLTKRIARLLVAAAALLLPLAAAAQDVITVGSATAAGSTVDIPVYVRDTAGMPLGVDQPAGSKIQSFSIRVNYSTSAAFSSAKFARAGVTCALSQTFAKPPTRDDSH